MKRIHLIYNLILVYILLFGFLSYPEEAAMGAETDRSSWWLSFALCLLVWALAYLLAYKRSIGGKRYKYGYYPEHQDLNEP